jgi:CRP-like cAMP-binding protein
LDHAEASSPRDPAAAPAPPPVEGVPAAASRAPEASVVKKKKRKNPCAWLVEYCCAMPDVKEYQRMSMTMTPSKKAEYQRFFVEEDNWHACRKLVFFPVAPLKKADFLMLMCVLYSSATVPYHVAFEEATGAFFAIEMVVQCVFMADVCLSFNTAVLEHEHWIVWRPRIAQVYLGFWFWIDATSAVPVELIELYIRSNAPTGTEPAAFETLAPLLRILRIFRMIRLLRMLKVCVCPPVSRRTPSCISRRRTRQPLALVQPSISSVAAWQKPSPRACPSHPHTRHPRSRAQVLRRGDLLHAIEEKLQVCASPAASIPSLASGETHEHAPHHSPCRLPLGRVPQINLKALRMLKTVAYLLIFCHLLACIFYATATVMVEEGSESWISEYDGACLPRVVAMHAHAFAAVEKTFGSLWLSPTGRAWRGMADGYILKDTTPSFDGYIIALWWAIGNVCGQGAPIDPENQAERCFTIVVYVVGTLFFAYIIAMVTEELQSYVNVPTNKAMDELNTFCRFHNISHANAPGLESASLEARLKTYDANYLATISHTDEEHIMQKLTPSLRNEVYDHLLSNTVRTLPLLSPPYDEEELQRFQEAVYKEIRPLTYGRHMHVIRKGVETDDLFFLHKGSVSATSVALGGSGTSHQHVLYPIFEPGSFFGEMCLCGKDGEKNLVDYGPRPTIERGSSAHLTLLCSLESRVGASARAVASSKTDLFSISGEGLIDAMHRYLSDEIRRSIAEKIHTDMKHKADMRLWGIRMAYAKLLEERNQLLLANGQSQRIEKEVLSLIQFSPWYNDFKAKNEQTHVLFLQIWCLLRRKYKTGKTSAAVILPRLLAGLEDEAGAKPLPAASHVLPSPDKYTGSVDQLAASVADMKKHMSSMDQKLDAVLQLLANK